MKIISLSNDEAGYACAVGTSIKRYYENKSKTNFFDFLVVSMDSINKIINMSNLDLSMANNLQNTKQMEPISHDFEVKETNNSILDKVKEPLLVLIISFVLNSPIVTSNIYRIMPQMLTNSINGIHLGVKYLGVFIQSILIALVFMLFKLFVLN